VNRSQFYFWNVPSPPVQLGEGGIGTVPLSLSSIIFCHCERDFATMDKACIPSSSSCFKHSWIMRCRYTGELMRSNFGLTTTTLKCVSAFLGLRSVYIQVQVAEEDDIF
jgi:hypothetical protein